MHRSQQSRYKRIKNQQKDDEGDLYLSFGRRWYCEGVTSVYFLKIREK